MRRPRGRPALSAPPSPARPTFLGRCGLAEDTFFSAPLPNLFVRRRRIEDGDEHTLWPAEAAAFGPDVKARRASGAARRVARELLRQHFGQPEAAIPRGQGGAPVWPAGFVGSLAHNEATAVAALARASDFRGLGIDIEPNASLGADLVALVATPREIRRYAPRVVESRLLFVVKEAVYKALNPLDGRFLEFHDIEVDLDALTARTVHGVAARVQFCVAGDVAALAYPV